MLQLTSRDEAMLDWMNVVRLADVDAIRWALSAYQDDHDGSPVSIRRANHWIARMAELGYLGRARPMYRDRQIVWPTHQASGRSAPRLFRQTLRHEVAVAAVSGRYLASGFSWRRDTLMRSARIHQTDGIAEKGRDVELVEVELTPKTLARYRTILGEHSNRLETEAEARVVYFCSSDVRTVVEREADRWVFREQRPRLSAATTFDREGRWLSDDLNLFERLTTVSVAASLTAT